MKLDFCVSERQIIYHNLKKNGFVLFYNLFTEKLACIISPVKLFQNPLTGLGEDVS